MKITLWPLLSQSLCIFEMILYIIYAEISQSRANIPVDVHGYDTVICVLTLEKGKKPLFGMLILNVLSMY